MTHRVLKHTAVMGLAALLISGCFEIGSDQAVSAKTIAAVPITAFPAQIDKACRNGKAKLYDECTDQTLLFQTALAKAEGEGKTVLVSYGADWCIWCHVFDAYIHGYVEKFTYTYGEAGQDQRYTHTMRERAKTDVSQAAYDLKKYVSENFVVVHIDYEHAPGGDQVLEDTNAARAFDGGLPFIFSVHPSGKFAANFNSSYVEVRRDTDDWYRGYDRTLLLWELKKMRAATVGK